jgi:hypothetical protein
MLAARTPQIVGLVNIRYYEGSMLNVGDGFARHMLCEQRGVSHSHVCEQCLDSPFSNGARFSRIAAIQ